VSATDVTSTPGVQRLAASARARSTGTGRPR
jgi:hypothetical protein